MRILVVEDDANLRRGLSELLTLEGFEAETAGDAATAIQLFAVRRPDFCILDVGLPSTDGFELCKVIRARDEGVPILFLTARNEEIDRVLGFGLGADDYVSKPFSSRELVARIRAILRRHKTSPAPRATGAAFAMRDVRIDPQALRAFRADSVIALTPREVSLLQLLFERAGQAVSRDDIYNHCWGREHFANSRALDQLVAILRRKIEVDPAEPEIISTVHGVGYRFDT